MASLQLPPCPETLKPIMHYLKTAQEHEHRDPVVTYWCRFYALQSALKIDKKSDDARKVLMVLVEWLEKQKKLLADNEAITNDIAAQAHIENYALKLFGWADSQDRAAVFNRNVVKTFYTSAMLMDVLNTFGDLTDEVAHNCKYAKWKASYIHNCQKTGETPIPGPMGWEESEENEGSLPSQNQQWGNTNQPGPSYTQPGPSYGFTLPGEGVAPAPRDSESDTSVTSGPPSNEPSYPHVSTPTNSLSQDTAGSWQKPYTPNVVESESPVRDKRGDYPTLAPNQITKAQKYCKFAASALNYDDIPEAVSNLRKALRLLQTGEDS